MKITKNLVGPIFSLISFAVQLVISVVCCNYRVFNNCRPNIKNWQQDINNRQSLKSDLVLYKRSLD